VAQFTVSFDDFRFYEDGPESTSVGLEDQGVNIGFDLAADFNFQLRVRLQEIGGKDGDHSDDYRLQYSKNGGTWTNVTTTSSNVKGFDSTYLTDGEATTTARIWEGASNAFVPGKVSETGEVVDHRLTANNYTVHLYSLTLISADIAVDDEIEFRVLLNGSTFTYNVVPKFTRLNLPPGQPTLYTEDEKEFSGGRPSFEFSATDPEGDDITYEVEFYDANDSPESPPFFSALSAEHGGFENIDNPSDIDPFNSGDKIKYTVPEDKSLEVGEYLWRVRGKDPNE